MVLLFLTALAGFLTRSLSYQLPDNTGQLPALGWSSWNAFGCNISAEVLANTADLLMSKGFKDAGYQYLNIDDCWGDQAGRNPTTGELQADLVKFPKGISGVAQYTHSKGLGQGIYSSAGYTTCQGYPASLGHEELDAQTFASWSIDYLKYDNCGAPERWYDTCYACDQDNFYNPDLVNGSCTDSTGLCPAGYDYAKSKTAQRYRRMANALYKQNRTILYSLCEWGINEPWTWGRTMGQSWRTTNDLSGFYGHNDMDLLQVGNGLTPAESRSHFALWAIMKSPLIISTNLASLSQQEIEILQNKYLIAFNQDKRIAPPAIPYKWGSLPEWTFNATSPAEYWSGQSSEGRIVALFNSQNQTQQMQVNWGEIPSLSDSSKYNTIDIWTGEKQSCVETGVKHIVAPHDIAILLVTSNCK